MKYFIQYQYNSSYLLMWKLREIGFKQRCWIKERDAVASIILKERKGWFGSQYRMFTIHQGDWVILQKNGLSDLSLDKKFYKNLSYVKDQTILEKFQPKKWNSKIYRHFVDYISR